MAWLVLNRPSDIILYATNSQLLTYPLFACFANARATSVARKNQSRRTVTTSPTSPVLGTGRSSHREQRRVKKKVPPIVQFGTLSCTSSAIGAVLVALPLFVGYAPSDPSQHQPQTTESPASKEVHLTNALRILQATSLLLGIPPIWTAVIRPRLYTTNISLHWVQGVKWHWVLFVSLLSLSAFSPASLVHFVSRASGWTLTFVGFVLPAFLHVTVHTIRKPAAIILSTGPDSTDDLLLRRKERSLQRKRWMGRAGWDLVTWIALAPAGSISLIWWTGRVVGLW